MDCKDSFASTCQEEMHETDIGSAENFQKYVYDLFDKNGVLQDLRAYLRRHIINVLKSAETGDQPTCQKHFSQRLDLTAQAINILIAEYLLRLDFNYSLSVFLSEIPLANMVFDFSKDIMNSDIEKNLRFKDKDVCSIVNYLGIKCDSNFINNVLEIYKSDGNTPLLTSIMKNFAVYQAEMPFAEVDDSAHSISISTERSSSIYLAENKKKRVRRHTAACRSCNIKMRKWKERYKICKEAVKKETSFPSLNVKYLRDNLRDIESNIMNEMLEQIHAVYEAELAGQEERSRQRSQADRAAIMHSLKQEMEAAYKEREEELESAVRAKKKLLWELAQSLKTQQEQMTRAMKSIKLQSQQLQNKENQLKVKIVETEKLLRHRGKDIREQISSELLLLEKQLEKVRRERESVDTQRAELEQLKSHHSSCNLNIDELENATSSYNILSNELSVLKKYFDATRLEPRCLVERGTITEANAATIRNNDILNNEQASKDTRDEDRVKSNQVINDFKKQKNVNFCVNNNESTESRDSSGDNPSIENVTLLKKENEQLKEYVKQQELRMRELATSSAQLRAELVGAHPTAAEISAFAAFAPTQSPVRPPLRPRSAGHHVPADNRSLNANDVGAWRKGAGEELGLYPCSAAVARVFVPGDTVPFIGLLRDRHTESRRLLNQWRRSRRTSPLGARRRPDRQTSRSGRSTHSPIDKSPVNDAPVFDMGSTNHQADIFKIDKTPDVARESKPQGVERFNKVRSKSPKSVLKEAKAKLKSNIKTKYTLDRPSSSREKSPASVLREAKLRLKKLEIEAQAVEQSYLDYRKRQSERQERDRYLSSEVNEEAVVTKDIGDLNVQSNNANSQVHSSKTNQQLHDINIDYEKYFCNYTHCNIESIRKLSDTQFANRNTVSSKIKPIPATYSPAATHNDKSTKNKNKNYLETPISKFRNFYTQPLLIPGPAREKTKMTPEINLQSCNKEDAVKNELETKKEALIQGKKQLELEILKHNITQIYNIPNDSVHEIESPHEVQELPDNELQIGLRIEVEEVHEIGQITAKEEDHNLVIVVQSKADAHEKHPNSDCTEKTTTIASQKKIKIKSDRSRSMSPEQAARLTRNDVLEAIFHTDTLADESSSAVRNDASKDEDVSTDTENEDNEDYADDFSADVDNYNHSPISLPASQADDSFWTDV